MSATPNTATGFPSLAKKIWIFAIIRGVLGIIFGLIALFAPIATAVVLAIVIGVWAIVDGVFDIVEAIRHRGSSSMALRIVLGAVKHPLRDPRPCLAGMSLGILVIFVGVWAIIIGILQIIASVGIAPYPTADGSGASSAAHWQSCSASWLLIRPGAGLVSIIWIIGIWAIVWGITLIVLGVQLRKAANTTEAKYEANHQTTSSAKGSSGGAQAQLAHSLMLVLRITFRLLQAGRSSDQAITEHELEQCKRANATSRPPVVFVQRRSRSTQHRSGGYCRCRSRR